VQFLSENSLNFNPKGCELRQTERDTQYKNRIPSVNAIIPICNWADRLELCLKRLTTQIYDGEFKITVVDCGSSDNTIDVAHVYGCDILTLKNAPVEGLKGLLNYGISNSKADLIWIIGADNLMKDNFVLCNLVEPFLEMDDVSISVPFQITNSSYSRLTNYLTYMEMDPMLKMVNQGIKMGNWYLVQDMWYGVYNSSLLRREAIESVGGWDQDIRVMGRLRKASLSKAAIVPVAGYYHDQRATPISYIKKISRRIRFFGNMNNAVRADYYVDPNRSKELRNNSSNNLERIITCFRSYIKTRDSIWLFGILYYALIVFAMLSTPISTLKIIKRGLYK
jgi:glycosyltransferase involved in cell wall biosynthesis